MHSRGRPCWNLHAHTKKYKVKKNVKGKMNFEAIELTVCAVSSVVLDCNAKPVQFLSFSQPLSRVLKCTACVGIPAFVAVLDKTEKIRFLFLFPPDLFQFFMYSLYIFCAF